MSTWSFPRDDIAVLVADAWALIAAFERRNPTSERSTLGEESALFNLWYRLDRLRVAASAAKAPAEEEA